MIYGANGAGKTHLALSMALAALAPGETIYVVDGDNAVGSILEMGLFPELSIRVEYEWQGTMKHGQFVQSWVGDPNGNVVIMHYDNWANFAVAMKQVEGWVQRDDWVIVETATRMYNQVQEWVVRSAAGSELPDWLMEHKLTAIKENKASDKNMALISDGFWQLVNTQWVMVVEPWATKDRCHVVFTCESKPIRNADGDKGKDSGEVLKLYRPFGEKPDTKRDLGGKLRLVVNVEVNLAYQRRWGVAKLWGAGPGALPTKQSDENMAEDVLALMQWKKLPEVVVANQKAGG